SLRCIRHRAVRWRVASAPRASRVQVSGLPARGGATTLGGAVKAVIPQNAPPLIIDWLRRDPWIRWLPLLIAVILIVLLFLLAPTAAAVVLAVALAGAAAAVFALILRWGTAGRASAAIAEPATPPSSVAAI